MFTNTIEFLSDEEDLDKAATNDFLAGCAFNALEVIKDDFARYLNQRITLDQSSPFNSFSRNYQENFIEYQIAKLTDAILADLNDIVNTFESKVLAESAEAYGFAKNREDDFEERQADWRYDCKRDEAMGG